MNIGNVKIVGFFEDFGFIILFYNVIFIIFFVLYVVFEFIINIMLK